MLLGLAAVLLVVAAAVFFFLRFQIRKSFPVTDGRETVPSLDTPVDVHRDEHGVPLIVAQTERTLMTALGYVHAQDRLWQMDLSRRAGEGRLSEVFGEPTVQFDHMFRVVGLRGAAAGMLDSMDHHSLDVLQWYADGVNDFIRSHKGEYPVEFDLLGYEPEPWQPLHTAVIMKLVAWELNLSWWTDLTLGTIAERVGLEKALDVMPSYPDSVPPAFRTGAWRQPLAGGMRFVRTGRAFAAAFGMLAASGGSNAWAVSPQRSATGTAILANDPHVLLSSPAMWYEVGLRGGGYDVRGMSVPGLPAVTVGRNARIAWGVTNLMADDADFYVEQLDSVHQETYLFEGRWRPLVTTMEEIQVRGDTSVAMTVRRTHRGPIVSDISTPLQKSRYPLTVSMRWTGYEQDDPLEAFLSLGRAGSWEEFSDAVARITVPGQNFIYADIEGNIGHRIGARIPVRSRGSAIMPSPGWTSQSDWKGFVAPRELPSAFNPPEGFVASANNRVAGPDYPHYMSDLWEPPARIQRLRDILGADSARFSVADFERLQGDCVSYFARELTPYFLAALASGGDAIPLSDAVTQYFRNWNHSFGAEDIASSIFHSALVRLSHNTFQDEMGEDLYHDFAILVNVPLRVLTRLMHEGTSPWFDDVRTVPVETRDEIVRKSLTQAIEDLRRRFGDDTKLWRWGDLHQVEFRHPLGLQKPLDIIFNIGPFPFPGGSTALMSGEYALTNPFNVTVGPSFRHIFNLGGVDGGRVVLSTGQSGQAFHPRYSDQTPLWRNGVYRTAVWDAARHGRETLRLEPSR